jgi:hypothetical protein
VNKGNPLERQLLRRRRVVIFEVKELVELTLDDLLVNGFRCLSSFLPQLGSSVERKLFDRSKTRNSGDRQTNVRIVPVMELENRTATCNCRAWKFGTNPLKEFLDMSNTSIVLGNLGIKPVSIFDCIESITTDMNSRLSGKAPLSWFKEMSNGPA